MGSDENQYANDQVPSPERQEKGGSTEARRQGVMERGAMEVLFRLLLLVLGKKN